ncbi:MAG: 4-amino-4-deoxy-L-arabinose-phosphoundecaprenol flippase subunit ArnE [Parcubacteria group bacterium ADurb.Bin305]|nr:MAG: 4-amino-4-deoxy-L-arabinose-phosphoundecaprenol flippase subunit ArnE [Parcubacteria group bacterium ADurb.Bin305]
MNPGIFFGLFAAFLFAFSLISLKKSFEEFPPSVAFLCDAVFGLVIWVPVSLILGVNPINFLSILPWALASAILSEAYYFYVLSKGEISLTGTILASYPIYTAILSRFINNEILNGPQIRAILITIIGTLIVTLDKNINLKDLKKKDYIFWALSGAIAVGLSDSLSKNAIDRISLQDFLFILAFVQVPVAVVYLKLEKEKLSHLRDLTKDIGKYKFALVGSLFNILGVLFLWISFSEIYASIASPLTATYPVLMVILAYIFLKEKVNKKDYFGIILVLIGIITLSRVS